MSIRRILAALLALAALAASGCNFGKTPPPEGTESMEEAVRAPRQSLLVVGLYSNELGEAYEDDDRVDEARAHYRRAVWAFAHHARLTGEEPVWLDEARDNLSRVSPR